MLSKERGLLDDVSTTIINIPVPKIRETELEVVHVFP